MAARACSFRVLLVLIGVLAAFGRPPVAAAQAREPAAAHASETSVREVIDQFCVRCHNDRARTAGLALDTHELAEVGADAETWERVIGKLRARTMPPAGSPRPAEATYRAVASWLETAIDTVAMASADPGRGETFHRLNRAEYHAAVRDLLAVDVDVAELLPADDTYEHGFDNNGDVLSISPDLVARYLSAARRISRLAVGTPPIGPAVATYRVHPGLLQDDRRNDRLSFGSRGGLAIRHHFPVDGEYTVRIRLHRNFSDYILGFAAPQELDVRVDGALVERFAVGDADSVGQMAPLSFSGNIAGDPEWEYYMNTGDAHLEVRFPAKAGRRTVGVSFVRRAAEPEGVLQPRNRGYGRFVDERYDDQAAVEQVAIGGPYTVEGPGDTPSRREIFVCRPATDAATAEAEACAGRILGKLARRAYRRPVDGADVEALLDFFRTGRRDGGFDDGIQFALERMLVDPEFLFRIERDPADTPPGTPYRLGDLELASRLSFFLWSSIPDDELLEAAADGRLGDPAELERQTRRLLADARSRALVDNFASQWLRLRNLASQERESADYPEFDENLREAFRRETELFVESNIREDRSLLELLGANYTFVNERLARHYGIRGVYGDRFRRVTLDPDHPRGGLLGQGGLLMVTSYPNRTSPVVRGKWLLETILGAPPPEPPPNVPGLPDRGEGGEPASVRDRLERHRANPACAGCHAPMDPLGFALENFDAIGSWRATSEAGRPIDASATMPSGEAFEGPAGLRRVLLSRGEDFAAAVTEKLLAYALGRGLEYTDRPAVRRILREAKDDELPLVVDRARHRREHAVPVAPFAFGRAGAGCRRPGSSGSVTPSLHYDEQVHTMMITKMSLPRRTVLRGLGAAVALPLLDAMVPAASALSRTAAAPTRRFGVVYVPNGIAMEYWTPAEEGRGFGITPILHPLEPFRDQLTVVSGLRGYWTPAHAGASTTFLTGAAGVAGETAPVADISMDQLLAREYSRHTELASLQLAIDSRANAGQCSGNHSCVYTNTICWRSRTTPLPMENNPRVVFEQMFGDSGSTDPAVRRARMARDRSILDSVTGKVADLRNEIGPADSLKVDEYLEGVRDIERRIQRAEQRQDYDLPDLAQPEGIPPTFAEHVELMFDLQVLAHQTDLTRVTSFMLGREVSSRTYTEIGIPDAHHPLSHHEYKPEKIALMSKINAYHASMFADYLAKLRSTPDGDGSLLDNMLLLYGCGMSDSNAHSPLDLPVLLLGGCGGQLEGGRHLRYPGDPLMPNLLVTLMDKLGVPVERLGKSNGRLNVERLTGV